MTATDTEQAEALTAVREFAAEASSSRNAMLYHVRRAHGLGVSGNRIADAAVSSLSRQTVQDYIRSLDCMDAACGALAPWPGNEAGTGFHVTDMSKGRIAVSIDAGDDDDVDEATRRRWWGQATKALAAAGLVEVRPYDDTSDYYWPHAVWQAAK